MGIYFADFKTTKEGDEIHWKPRMLNPGRRTLRDLVDLPPPVLPGLGYRVDVLPDGQTMLLVHIEDRGSDLMLLEDVR